jgi:hypothetical protein
MVFLRPQVNVFERGEGGVWQVPSELGLFPKKANFIHWV